MYHRGRIEEERRRYRKAAEKGGRKRWVRALYSEPPSFRKSAVHQGMSAVAHPARTCNR